MYLSNPCWILHTFSGIVSDGDVDFQILVGYFQMKRFIAALMEAMLSNPCWILRATNLNTQDPDEKLSNPCWILLTTPRWPVSRRGLSNPCWILLDVFLNVYEDSSFFQILVGYFLCRGIRGSDCIGCFQILVGYFLKSITPPKPKGQTFKSLLDTSVAYESRDEPAYTFKSLLDTSTIWSTAKYIHAKLSNPCWILLGCVSLV